MNTPNDSKRGIVKASLLFALALTSCGGGGSSAPVPREAPQQISTILFQQAGMRAVLVNDPGDESWIPRNDPHVSTFDMGAAPITDDEHGIGIVNDSWTAPNGSKPIKAANYSWFPSVGTHPWADGDASVCTSFKASIPQSYMRDSVPPRALGTYGNYAGADIWLKDISTGKQIIVSGTFFFDHITPSDGGPDTGPWDYLKELNAVQWRGSLGHNDIFTTTAGTMRGQPWSEPTEFGYCINRTQALKLIAASADMLGYLMDIKNVVIKQAFISNETNLGVPSTTDRAGVGAFMTSYFSDWTVSIQRAQ